MAQQEILIWPDSRLAEKSVPVTVFDDDLKTLVSDMLETMYEEDGIGLAAPQVGVHKRVVVIDIFSGQDEVPEDHEPLVLINPEFIEKKGHITWEEGCLSVPGETGDVKRANEVRVRYQNLEGEWYEIAAEELLAVALQHENDHLDGILFVDHLSVLKRKIIKRKMLKLKAELDAQRAAS